MTQFGLSITFQRRADMPRTQVYNKYIDYLRDKQLGTSHNSCGKDGKTPGRHHIHKGIYKQ